MARSNMIKSQAAGSCLAAQLSMLRCSASTGGEVLVTALPINLQVAGLLMLNLNQEANTMRQPEYLEMKACINEAIQLVFPGGHHQVQPQGSTAKGTALSTSDWDFFIRMDKTVDPVTKNQRTRVGHLIWHALNRRGLRYKFELRRNRIRFYEGSCNEQVVGGLPDADVIFQRYRADERLEPNSRALADSHVRQQVVKQIKLMPSSFTNLRGPKSFRVEEFTRLVEEELWQGQEQLGVGSRGFALLLAACLLKIGGWLGTTPEQEEQLREAGLRELDWKRVSRRYLMDLS